ncbi:MAG: polyprenyl synthetase family protein [Alphaproteobacteria bacterium]|nr:polyprenyl synthetase family protein [Alphaproteobacteria bacterium]
MSTSHPISEFKTSVKAVASDVEAVISELLEPIVGAQGRLVEAMRHAALGGGKRLRPFATVSCSSLFNVPRHQALRTAAAIELVHCYSLVHDDLPGLDDSDLRHGLPSVHKAFDEATAILAGDALLTLAFEVLMDERTHSDAEVRGQLVLGLARSAGYAGLLGGQMLDMEAEKAKFNFDEIRLLQDLKSGALLRFACGAGAILGEADPISRAAIDEFARELGLAYQIADDLLDLEGSSDTLGKPTGQDKALGKATFPSIMGVARARALEEACVTRALAQLEIFDDRAQPLRELARFAIERTY